jgi:hypothetical protein
MKNLNKKALMIIASLFFTCLSFGQTDLKFYATFEDYKNNKPMAGYDIQENSWQMAMGKESIKVITASGTEKKKLEELPSKLFTLKGYLIRSYEGHCYAAKIAENKLCYYVLYNLPDKEYYSEGVDAEIKKYSNKVFMNYLKEHGLYDTYKNDHGGGDYQKKYFKILSDKMK